MLQAIHRDYDSYTTWSRWQADRFDYMTSLRRKGVNVSDRPVIHSQNEMTTLYGQSPLATTARQQTATLTWTTVHTYWSQLMYSRLLAASSGSTLLIPSIWPKRPDAGVTFTSITLSLLTVRASYSSTQVYAHHRLMSRLICVLLFVWCFSVKKNRPRQRLTRFHHLLVRHYYVDQY